MVLLVYKGKQDIAKYFNLELNLNCAQSCTMKDKDREQLLHNTGTYHF